MPQRHTIHRKVVEVTVANAATAERISPLISDLVRNAIMPLLEQVFDDLTPHAELVRVDRLELDLGRLAPGSLQQDLPARIAAKLAAAMLGHTATARPSAGNKRSGASADSARTRPDADAAALLVINHFVRTGALPWWCDSRGRDLLDRAVEAALLRSPASLIHSLRGLVADATAMNRLVAHLSDPSLHLIAAALAPATVTLVRELATLVETASVGGLTPRQRRLVMWRALLYAACAGAPSDFVETALAAMAIAAGMPLTLVLAACEAATAEQAPSEITARIGEMRRVQSALLRPDGLAESAHRIGSADGALAALYAELAPVAGRLPEPGQRAWAAAFERLAHAPAGTSLDDDAGTALLRPLLDAGLMTSAEAQRLRARLPRRAPPAPRPPEQPVDAEDSHAVAAAGVCLLWPFLSRFFGRHGLLNDKQTRFASVAAQQRAVLLLHHLATGERDPAEFSLMLPKVLCGMPPFDPCEIIEPVTDAEDAEAGQLLDAAIAHAASLGTISHAGLRETFLMRNGLLATRDGAWLLRLERRSADVLLARIPWTLQWLRLPWMQAAMRVEW
jgi:hypothetical protein